MRHAEARLWNPYLEAMPRRELDELHLRRVRRVIEYAYRHLPFYRRRYEAAGVRPEHIRSWEDFLERVPLLDKPDLMEAQERGELVPADPPPHQLCMTSGTTGVPLRIPWSAYQMIRNGDHGAYLWWSAGIRPGQTLYIAFNFGTFVGFWTVYHGALSYGLNVISGGGLDTRRRLLQVAELRPDVLAATPTYALHMAEVARQMGLELRACGVRALLLAGEAGACVPAIRNALREAWGAEPFDYYGTSETGGIGFSCHWDPTRIHVLEDGVHCLVLDEGGRPVQEGTGEVVVTTYYQLSFPLIKYRTHDLVEVHREPCPCGRTWAWFRGGVLGRTDHMITVRGVNVFPTAIEALVGEVGGTTEHYEIHVFRREGLDQLLLKVEAAPGVPAERYGALQRELEELLHHRLKVRVPVEVLPPGSLPRYELKSKRFFDHRHEAG